MTPYEEIRANIENGNYDNRVKYSRENKDEYRRESTALVNTFRAELAVAFGLFQHPKEDRVFHMAWDRVHSSGYMEVLSEYQDLADLILK